MERKFYIFLVLPSAHGKLRKIRLPFYTVQLFLAFSLVGVMTMAALANSYARMLLKVSDYNDLRTQREALKSQYRAVEDIVNQSNAKLNSLQSLAAEVALSYGLGDARRLRFPPAVLLGPTSRDSTSEPSYTAWFYPFQLLKTTRRLSSGTLITRGLVLDPLGAERTTPSIWPVRGRVTTAFGQWLDPLTGEGVLHTGIDIAVPPGVKLEATADGIVFRAGPGAAYGNEILIDHGYGITTRYDHLSTTYVVVGQEVKRGQIIGAVDMTGRSIVPHLHYEVRIQQTPVNPAKYLRG